MAQRRRSKNSFIVILTWKRVVFHVNCLVSCTSAPQREESAAAERKNKDEPGSMVTGSEWLAFRMVLDSRASSGAAGMGASGDDNHSHQKPLTLH